MKKSILLFGFLMSISQLLMLNAQSMIGYINSDTIRSYMPQYHRLLTDFDSLSASYKKKLDSMYSEYEKMQSSLQTYTYKNRPDSAIEAEIQNLQNNQLEIQNYETVVMKELDAFREGKLKLINNDLSKALKQVAQSYGYLAILDIAKKGIEYFYERSDNVNRLVMIQLGLR